ncbi:hypothetical protein ElyMa_001383900 [Elysia marginata]|uniref:Uncharacterized protein n=1 Tax=Elysia marginata TaxID=1093978 RepID=A0AAV4ITC0_9GAST|nr:hypothetical protein ElyMa_001383900 [Elysia marginata]
MSRAGKFRPNGPSSSSGSLSLSNGKATMPSTNVSTSSQSSSNFNNNNSNSSNINNNHNLKDTQNGSAGNSFSEMSDEASSSEPDNGPVTLDVELPSGKHTDIVVEYR